MNAIRETPLRLFVVEGVRRDDSDEVDEFVVEEVVDRLVRRLAEFGLERLPCPFRGVDSADETDVVERVQHPGLEPTEVTQAETGGVVHTGVVGAPLISAWVVTSARTAAGPTATRSVLWALGESSRDMSTDYRRLGSTGTRVSELCFGTWRFGRKSSGVVETKKDEAHELLDTFADHGGTFIDTTRSSRWGRRRRSPCR